MTVVVAIAAVPTVATLRFVKDWATVSPPSFFVVVELCSVVKVPFSIQSSHYKQLTNLYRYFNPAPFSQSLNICSSLMILSTCFARTLLLAVFGSCYALSPQQAPLEKIPKSRVTPWLFLFLYKCPVISLPAISRFYYILT